MEGWHPTTGLQSAFVRTILCRKAQLAIQVFPSSPGQAFAPEVTFPELCQNLEGRPLGNSKRA